MCCHSTLLDALSGVVHTAGTIVLVIQSKQQFKIQSKQSKSVSTRPSGFAMTRLLAQPRGCNASLVSSYLTN
jgi:hypothetical protein